jgi:serine/threonine-protein kinase
LQHENIIPILDWGYKQKVLYYTMKKVDGPTLAELMRVQRLTPAESGEILAPLSNALDFIHSQGVMHRDVKPANILLESVDGHWHIYLSDFGLGKNLKRDKPLPMISRSMGTVEYMSPESIAKHPADYRTDIYSLAAIAYEMLLGIKPPRVKRNPNGNTIQDILLLPSFIRAEFPYPLEAVLIHGMEIDREWRFQSARAFMDAYNFALLQLTEEQRDTQYQYIFKQNTQIPAYPR